jgi:hypothetical protein
MAVNGDTHLAGDGLDVRLVEDVAKGLKQQSFLGIRKNLRSGTRRQHRAEEMKWEDEHWKEQLVAREKREDFLCSMRRRASLTQYHEQRRRRGSFHTRHIQSNLEFFFEPRRSASPYIIFVAQTISVSK